VTRAPLKRTKICYHARTPVESNGVGLEQRLSSLQTQIDDLRHAAGDEVRPLEQRLSTLTEYSASILRRWDATADRHARAVSQLEAHLRELGDAGTRLQDDASQRLQDLERIVQQEWNALRELHETPVKQLIEQAASLTEVCIATANSAQQGFDRAEARLSTLEADFHRTAAELTREVHAVLTEVRQLSASNQRQLPSEAPAWPLEDVTRLHQQLRETTTGTRALPAATAVPPTHSHLSLVEPAPLQSDHTAPAVADPSPGWSIQPSPAPPAAAFARVLVGAGIVLLVIISGVLVWRLQRDMRAATARAEQSQVESRIAAETAARESSERQEAAARQLAAAQDLATKAQTIGDVLAAPDLVRYTLVAPRAVRGATGQVLWSRSRGFVFSASGLAAPALDATYQVWMLIRGGAVSAGTFVPDASGQVTLTRTLNVPRPVIGAIVTTERKGGAESPVGDLVLTRQPAAPAPAE
jgi:hypothetical protein